MRIVSIQNKWKENFRDNFEHVLKLTEKACAENAPDFVCLPEFFLGPPWFLPGQEMAKGITDDTIPGKVTNEFSKLANKYNTYIICGTIIEKYKDTYFNTSVFIDNQGNIAGKSNKVHTFAGEKIHCSAGDEFKVYPTKFGLAGIAVCSDFWILECPRILSVKGAKILFVPGGALKQNVAVNRAVIMAMAYLNNVIIVSTSPLGKAEGMRGDRKVSLEYAGLSMITSPTEIIAESNPEKEDVIVADISQQYLNSFRKPSELSNAWKNISNRNPINYKDILLDYAGATGTVNDEFKNRNSP